MNSIKLYEIPTAIEACIDEEGNINAEQLRNVNIAIKEKGAALCAVLKNFKAEARALDDEIKRLTARKRAVNNASSRLRDYVLSGMKLAGMKRIGNGVHELAIQKSPIGIEITDEASVPVNFKIVIPESLKVDKKAIIKHIKETGEIPEGCEPKHGEHLRVK